MAYKIIPITQRKDGSLSIDTTNIKIKQGDYDSYQLAFESNHDIPDGTFIQVSFRRADGQQSGYLTLTKVSSTRLYLNMKNRWFTNVAGLLYMTFIEKEITTQNVEKILKEQSISLMIYAGSDFNPIEDIIPSDFDVYKLEVDSKLSTKLDKDFSKFENDTSIDGTELIPIYDNGTNKTINSNLLVNKVNTVNNVQPDNNKNITLKGNNIDTSLTYASLQDKTLDELFEMFYLLSIRGVYHEDTDDEQLMSIRTGEYKNINPKTIAVNVSTTLSNVQDELNNIKNQIQYVYLFKGVYDNEVELLKAYPNGTIYDDGIWCILTDTDTVWVYDNDTLKWKNTGSTISGVLSVNDITPDNNGNIYLSGTDIKATVSDNGIESEKNITQHLQQLYNYVYALPNIDSAFDSDSTRPLQNKVITDKFFTIDVDITNLKTTTNEQAFDITSNTNNIASTNTKINNHIANKNNPHGVTKSQIGLGNVDNTSDKQKPVSTAQANAINVVQSNLDEFITTTNNNFNKCLLKSGGSLNNGAGLKMHITDPNTNDMYDAFYESVYLELIKNAGSDNVKSIKITPSNIIYTDSKTTSYTYSFPTKSGTLALTTDVTDILSDKTVVKNINISASGDNVSISETKTNLGNDTETTETNNIPLANDTTGGLMSSADYKQIRNNTSRIEQLEGQTTRLLYTASENPTASDINTFVTGLGYTSPFNGIAVVVDNTYHIWHYYENDNIGWRDDGADTVNQFTNNNLGTIKGTATDGKVYAETDGTGSVYGWDNLKSTVSDINSNLQNKANYSDLNNYLPLSGGTVSGNITFPFGKGLYTADGKNLLICYADKNLYVGEKDKKFYVNGVEDRPLYNCPKGVYELALLSDCPTQQEKEFLTSEYEKSLNLLNALAKVQTINGATLIIDNNGKCTWSGTSTGAFGFSYTNNINLKPNTTYTFKVFNQTGTLPFAIYFYDYDKSVSYGSLDLGTTTNGSSTFTTPDDIGTNIKFDSYIQANLTLNGSFQVMCVEGSTAPVTYQPYNGAIVHEKDIEDCAKKTDILNKLDKTAGIQTMWSGTQSEYDAITTKDATTLYFIKEE